MVSVFLTIATCVALLWTPKFTNISRFLSPFVQCSHWEEPIVSCCWGQGERDLDLLCGERNKGCISVAKGQRSTQSHRQIPLLRRQLYIIYQSRKERGQGIVPLCGQQSCEPRPIQQGHGTHSLLWVDLLLFLASTFFFFIPGPDKVVTIRVQSWCNLVACHNYGLCCSFGAIRL